MQFTPIPDEVEAIAKRALDCCFRVHSVLGPGLFEKVYETCVCHELAKAAIPHQRQISQPIEYDGLVLDDGFFIDVLVAESVVFELKAVERLTSDHEAQLLTYMRLSGSRLGFLLNFNSARLKDGIKRRVL